MSIPVISDSISRKDKESYLIERLQTTVCVDIHQLLPVSSYSLHREFYSQYCLIPNTNPRLGLGLRVKGYGYNRNF